jgi:hypothetical protein
MLNALVVVVLAYGKPSYDEKYLTGCYENEDAERCKDRQARWQRDIKQWEDEQAADEASRLEAFSKENADVIEPIPGVAKIEAQRPSWCEGRKELEGYAWGSVARYLNSYKSGRAGGVGGLEIAAQVLCRKPDNEAVKRVTGNVLQAYVNATGVSADEATKNLVTRMDQKALSKSKKALCKAIEIDEEAMGGEKTFGLARRAFFGCSPSTDEKVDEMLWNGRGGEFGFSKLLWYLDTDAKPASELVRLAYLLDTLHTPADDYSYKASIAVRYAWMGYDVKNFDAEQLKAEFAEAPYKDNVWAQLMLSESLGAYKLAAAEFEAFVKKIAKDDDWKNIVWAAPEKAIKEWTATNEANKAAMQEARDFEVKLFSPSLKASKGCSAKLRASLTTWIKGLKVKPAEFDRAIAGNMVGSFLLQHLVACEAVEGNNAYSRLLDQVRKESRLVRGPRLAAYYAAVEAVGQAKADRPKFPLEPNQLWSPTANEIEQRVDEVLKQYESLLPIEGSLVKSVAKTPKGLKVTFVTTSYQFMGQSCVSTNRIYRINSSGVIEYYQSCKDTGMQTATSRVDDVTIPNEFATGIAAGRWLNFERTVKDMQSGFPTSVFADKSKAKLVNWYGLGL